MLNSRMLTGPAEENLKLHPHFCKAFNIVVEPLPLFKQNHALPPPPPHFDKLCSDLLANESKSMHQRIADFTRREEACFAQFTELLKKQLASISHTYQDLAKTGGGSQPSVSRRSSRSSPLSHDGSPVRPIPTRDAYFVADPAGLTVEWRAQEDVSDLDSDEEGLGPQVFRFAEEKQKKTKPFAQRILPPESANEEEELEDQELEEAKVQTAMASIDMQPPPLATNNDGLANTAQMSLPLRIPGSMLPRPSRILQAASNLPSHSVRTVTAQSVRVHEPPRDTLSRPVPTRVTNYARSYTPARLPPPQSLDLPERKERETGTLSDADHQSLPAVIPEGSEASQSPAPSEDDDDDVIPARYRHATDQAQGEIIPPHTLVEEPFYSFAKFKHLGTKEHSNVMRVTATPAAASFFDDSVFQKLIDKS
jgi:hypothetical protein